MPVNIKHRPAPLLSSFNEQSMADRDCGLCKIEVSGVITRYLKAGSGQPLLLLHGNGESALDWQWLMSVLDDNCCLYAPDLPGTTELAYPDTDYSPEFLAHFALSFLTALNVERAIVVGNSLGGLVALYMALGNPDRVKGLGLVSPAGLGQAIHPSMRFLSLPGYGELMAHWGRTPFGALQRVWFRTLLLFAHPERVPGEWLREQYRLARLSHFLYTTEHALRGQVNAAGQRHILLDQLSGLKVPVLIAWGQKDQILPVAHGRRAARCIPAGRLDIIPDCGHLAQVEEPVLLANALQEFFPDQVRSC
jgi:pimeloyl-ACP methyl ester carboxylesterase